MAAPTPEDPSCIVQFREVVQRHGGRLTRERISLLQAIRDMPGHFLPEDLARRLREDGQQISVTTVYRNIPLLVEAGIIRRACIAEEETGGGARYEHIWGREHHDHLVCSVCGQRVEFSYPAIDVLQEAVAEAHGFRLQRHHLELVGVCPRCRRQEENAR